VILIILLQQRLVYFSINIIVQICHVPPTQGQSSKLETWTGSKKSITAASFAWET